jgi:hypothetical protein
VVNEVISRIVLAGRKLNQLQAKTEMGSARS